LHARLAAAQTSEIPAASFSSAPFDGILGIATETQAVNPTYVPTIFEQIVKVRMRVRLWR
jgi:hypothetical protein